MSQELLAKRLPLCCSLTSHLQSSLGHSNHPHTMMDSTGTKPPLGYLKPTAFTCRRETVSFAIQSRTLTHSRHLTQNHIGYRYSYIVEVNLQVTVGGIIITKHREGSYFLDPRSIEGDNNHSMTMQPVSLEKFNKGHV